MAVGETTIYLLAGMRVKIEIPIDDYSGHAFFPYDPLRYGNPAGYPYHPPFTFRGKDVSGDNMVNGFWLEDEEIGEIVPEQTGLAIEYHHKKNGKNKIWFKAATGELATVIVDSVPIHDHSSVVQGGPAYGTYFSDDDAV